MAVRCLSLADHGVALDGCCLFLSGQFAGSRLILSLLARYRPTYDTNYPKHPHPTPSTRHQFPAHPDVVVVMVVMVALVALVALAEFMAVVELVEFGRREEALMTKCQIAANQTNLQIKDSWK